MNKVNRQNAEHYIWGDNCEGWRLVNSPELSIIYEKMPPGTSEKKHYHKKAKQFFFIVDGMASIETEEKIYHLEKHEGLEILPGIKHRFFNSSDGTIEFIVTSNPSTLNDRFDVD